MHATLERLRVELVAGVAGLSAEQTQTRSHPGKWNVQQIVEHLVMTYEATAAVVAERLAKGKPTGASPTVAQRFGQWAIADLGLFPPGRKSPAMVDPGETGQRPKPGTALDQEIERSLTRMDAELAVAEKVFGSDARAVSHLILGPMSVPQWRSFHLTHARHHLKQITRIRKRL